MQPTDSKRLSMTRSNKGADEMAPLVREIAGIEFRERPNTEKIAVQFKSGRLHIVDAVMDSQNRRIEALERRLGIQRRPVTSATREPVAVRRAGGAA